MIRNFPKAAAYVSNLDLNQADELDRIVKVLLDDGVLYEKVDDVLGRKFRHGKDTAAGMDRDGRVAMIRRETVAGRWFRYLIQGANGSWYEPEEKIWVLAMTELARRRKRRAAI